MLPLLIWIGGGVISVVCCAGMAALRWNEIVMVWKGKRLAVLGERGVGKTHLVKFLSTGSIPEEYKQTVLPEKAGARRFKLKG
jgi:hypothetical protein